MSRFALFALTAILTGCPTVSDDDDPADDDDSACECEDCAVVLVELGETAPGCLVTWQACGISTDAAYLDTGVLVGCPSWAWTISGETWTEASVYCAAACGDVVADVSSPCDPPALLVLDSGLQIGDWVVVDSIAMLP